MRNTHFHDFLKDDGRPVTVEFSATGGEDNFDYPGHICDGGGSGPEIVIVDAWPNTPQYDLLYTKKLQCETTLGRCTGWGGARSSSAIERFCAWFGLQDVRLHLWLERVRLTDAERERMEEYLAEHHVEDPPDFEDWHR